MTSILHIQRNLIDNIAKGTLKQWHLEDMDKISKDKDVVLLLKKYLEVN